MSKELTIRTEPSHTETDVSTLAKPLAPEDIRVGMHVMVLTEVFECLRWNEGFPAGVTKSLVEVTPCNGQRPAKVTAVCLPYILVKTDKGEPYCYDVRAVRLARVSRALATSVKSIDHEREKKLKKKERSNKRKTSKPRAKRKRRG